MLVGNAVRTNAHSIAKGTTVPWWAVPDDATMDYVPPRVGHPGGRDRHLKVWYRADGTILYNRTSRWQCAAPDFYDGACRVEVTDGTSWYALVGQRLLNTSATYGWRITNGLVRVSYGGGDGLLTVEHYISGAWSVSRPTSSRSPPPPPPSGRSGPSP